MLSSNSPGGVAQFFDRDFPAEMAKAAMEGMQEFMVFQTTWMISLSVSNPYVRTSTKTYRWARGSSALNHGMHGTLCIPPRHQQ